VAVAPDLTHDHAAGIDADANAWPILVLLGQPGKATLKRQSRARRSHRMVRLIAPGVERRHDAVAHELLDVAAKTRDHGRCGTPVRIERRGCFRRREALGEGREADEVGEENADILMAFPRGR
jgi:hypothetical protein